MIHIVVSRRLAIPDRKNMEKWQGKNLLGFALMAVRTCLDANITRY
jgi:predicted NAD-dependent protein-ADP-ribosyltransferase YbiA (DUF1768 family)